MRFYKLSLLNATVTKSLGGRIIVSKHDSKLASGFLETGGANLTYQTLLIIKIFVHKFFIQLFALTAGYCFMNNAAFF